MTPFGLCFNRVWRKTRKVCFWCQLFQKCGILKNEFLQNAKFHKFLKVFKEIAFLTRRISLQRCRKVCVHLGPFSPGAHFSQNGAKMTMWFGKNISWPQKVIFCTFRPRGANTNTTNGSGGVWEVIFRESAFCSAHMGNGPQNGNLSTFCTFCAKGAKREPFQRCS